MAIISESHYILFDQLKNETANKPGIQFENWTLRVETITLGDELPWYSEMLTYLGAQLAHHRIIAANLVIRDQAEDIKLFFTDCWERSDVVITTGGLGPTSDDITRETIAEILGEKMVYDTQIEDAIKERFLQLEQPMPKSNNRQCYRPESAEVLNNPYGTALAFLLRRADLVDVTGPARRCIRCFWNKGSQITRKGIFGNRLLPAIENCRHRQSALAELVQPILSDVNGLVVGYCAHAGMVDLRLSSLDGNSISKNNFKKLGIPAERNLGKISFALEITALPE